MQSLLCHCGGGGEQGTHHHRRPVPVPIGPPILDADGGRTGEDVDCEGVARIARVEHDGVEDEESAPADGGAGADGQPFRLAFARTPW